jgi:ATP synthase F1 gamma subunit
MTTKQIKELIIAGEGLKTLAESYTEIASLKLKQIRDDVERNRAFFEELTGVYGIVKQIASREKLVVNFKTKDTISIILTSNYRFYGNINNRVSDTFYKQSQTYKSDFLVIGKTGQQLLKPLPKTSGATYVVLKHDMPDDEELQALAKYIQPYNRILVYYPQFKSVLVQLPVIKDITQSHRTLQNETNTSLTDNLGFILEPEIAEMLVFFDSQITALLLQETFLESELSRTASRLIAMDQAQSNADEYVGTQKNLLIHTQKSITNMKILETINAYATIKMRTQKAKKEHPYG